MEYEITSNGLTLKATLAGENGGTLIRTETGKYHVAIEPVSHGVYSVLLNNRSFIVGICDQKIGQVNVEGRPMDIALLDEIHLRLRDLGWDSAQSERVGQIVAQIPGLVTKVFHQEGEAVTEGDPVFLMEAMKMENEIRAPISGTIKRIHVKAGETVEKGTAIIEII